jgi:diguanylate cyclase (GGDEF)-like protein
MNTTICAFVCHHYQKELETIIEQENIQGVEIQEYFPVCIRPKMQSNIAKRISEKDNGCLIADACVLAQDNHKGKSPKPSIGKSQLGNCLQVLSSKELLDFYAANGGYLVSPGWLSVWKSNLKEWGFDQVTAKQFFSEFSKEIILLNTGVDSNSSTNLTQFAEYLDLPYQIIPVGLEHFRLQVKNKISNTQLKQTNELLATQIKTANQQVADYALAFDLVTNLTRMMNESEAMREIDNTFKMLFSPKNTSYVSLQNGDINHGISQFASEEKEQELREWAVNSSEEYIVSENKDGFYIRISHQSQTLGVAEISEIAFPQYLEKYLNMSLSIAPLFGLAISKARTYQQLEEDEVKLQKLASTDSLTGLYNRRYFLSVLENEFSRSKRYHSPLSAVLLDIDHFKLVNDTYGHPVGDKVLMDLSNIITGELRKSDIAARLGGDEFIILLPETDQNNALIFSNRLRVNIEKSLSSIDLGQNSLTISVGVSEINQDCHTSEDILHHCDQALYNSKNLGRNIVSVWGK